MTMPVKPQSSVLAATSMARMTTLAITLPSIPM
jgi:hypothetical protein